MPTKPNNPSTDPAEEIQNPNEGLTNPNETDQPTNPTGFQPVAPVDTNDDLNSEDPAEPKPVSQVLEELDLADLAKAADQSDAIQQIMGESHASDGDQPATQPETKPTDFSALLGVPMASLPQTALDHLTAKPQITDQCFIGVQHYNKEVGGDGQEVLIASPIIEGYRAKDGAGNYQPHLAELLGYKCATVTAPTQDEGRPLGETHQQSQAQAWGWPIETITEEIPDGKGGIAQRISPKLDAQGNTIKIGVDPQPLYLVNCRRQLNDGITKTVFQSKDGGLFLYSTRQAVVRDNVAVTDGAGNPVYRENYSSFNIQESSHPGLEHFRAVLRAYRESEPLEGEHVGVTASRAFAKNMPDDTAGSNNSNNRAMSDNNRTIRVQAGASDVNPNQAQALFGR